MVWIWALTVVKISQLETSCFIKEVNSAFFPELKLDCKAVKKITEVNLRRKDITHFFPLLP